MKATLFTLVALAAGIAAGIGFTQHEFSREVMPVDVQPVSADGSRPAPKVGPKVTIVNGERYDFGTMDRNGQGKHEFIVRNDGDAPLTISTGQPSCSVCIKVFRVEKDKLQPGEKTEAQIEWDVKAGETDFEQSGPINTNDPKRPTVTLTVKGHIQETLKADRTDVHFHDVSINEPSNASVNTSISARSVDPYPAGNELAIPERYRMVAGRDSGATPA